MEKTDKDADKAAKQAAKQAEFDAKCETDFAAKKGASGSAFDKLNKWLDNPPFKSSNEAMKRETLMTVIAAVMEIKPADIDKIKDLNDKTLITLSKYLYAAFGLIAEKEDEDFIKMVNNGQHLLKLQLKIKEKMGNACILKAQFEKNEIV